MSFEGEEDLDIEFGDVIPCDCSEGSYGHINALVELDWSPRFSFRNRHFGDCESGFLDKWILEFVESKVSSMDSWGSDYRWSNRGKGIDCLRGHPTPQWE